MNKLCHFSFFHFIKLLYLWTATLNLDFNFLLVNILYFCSLTQFMFLHKLESDNFISILLRGVLEFWFLNYQNTKTTFVLQKKKKKRKSTKNTKESYLNESAFREGAMAHWKYLHVHQTNIVLLFIWRHAEYNIVN